MEQNFKIAVPEGCKAEIKQENGFLVVTFEPEKWEPKDGDVVAFGNTPDSPSIGIFKMDNCDTFISYATICDCILSYCEPGWVKNNIRPATDSEKQRLFDALTKKGKRWNAEEKCIEDLPQWRSLYGENYYFIGSMLTVDCLTETGHSVDDKRYYAGNYFKTREAAEKVAIQIRDIFKNSKAE